MLLNDLWFLFETEIFPIKSSAGMFNQYHDSDRRVDLPNAANVRRNNLRNYIASFEKKPSILLIGEAPGPWGCRFSGIPFTGERQLLTGVLPFTGRRSSRPNPRINVRKSAPYISNSARIFWSTMLRYHPLFLVWNCIPYHPYMSNNLLSVRAPTSGEVRSYANSLKKIITAIKPEGIVAVGRKAQFSVDILGLSCSYVRHPSQGGALKFKEGIRKIFDRS